MSDDTPATQFGGIEVLRCEEKAPKRRCSGGRTLKGAKNYSLAVGVYKGHVHLFLELHLVDTLP